MYIFMYIQTDQRPKHHRIFIPQVTPQKNLNIHSTHACGRTSSASCVATRRKARHASCAKGWEARRKGEMSPPPPSLRQAEKGAVTCLW